MSPALSRRAWFLSLSATRLEEFSTSTPAEPLLEGFGDLRNNLAHAFFEAELLALLHPQHLDDFLVHGERGGRSGAAWGEVCLGST